MRGNAGKYEGTHLFPPLILTIQMGDCIARACLAFRSYHVLPLERSVFATNRRHSAYVVDDVDLAGSGWLTGVCSTAAGKLKAAREGRRMPRIISRMLAKATGRNATAGRCKRSQS